MTKDDFYIIARGNIGIVRIILAQDDPWPSFESWLAGLAHAMYDRGKEASAPKPTLEEQIIAAVELLKKYTFCHKCLAMTESIDGDCKKCGLSKPSASPRSIGGGYMAAYNDLTHMHVAETARLKESIGLISEDLWRSGEYIVRLRECLDIAKEVIEYIAEQNVRSATTYDAADWAFRFNTKAKEVLARIKELEK